MIVDLDEATDQLNLEGVDDLFEVQLYVDAANEWVETKVTDTSPSYVKLATLFLIDHLWSSSQRGPASIPIPGDDTVTVAGVGYAIPNRVLELLQPMLARTSPSGSFPDAAAWPDPVEWPAP